MSAERPVDNDTAIDGALARPIRVERRNRDQDVMDAATSVMSQRGYSATSVQEIADQVGVLKGSLYHYFSSKEELLFRVLSESHAQADKIRDEVVALGLSPIDELMEFLRRLSVWFMTNIDRANIYFTEARHLTGDRQKRTLRLGREFVQYLQSLITAAQQSGDIRSTLHPTLLTEYVLGALNNVRAWPSRSGKDFSQEEMSEAFVTITRHALQA